MSNDDDADDDVVDDVPVVVILAEFLEIHDDVIPFDFSLSIPTDGILRARRDLPNKILPRQRDSFARAHFFDQFQEIGVD